MTNYNERLDKIFPDESKDTELQHHLRNVWHDNFSEQEFIDEMEAYITSLIKELVAEAKPYGKRQFRELIEDAWYEAPTAAAGFGRIEAIHNQFEQNLLKALEEV
ncbi:hypothetical protein EKK58_09405 [Candidatus Dependentiae bacterium]|nr:MAG: hypothetical protein EKK58_09405 [Candidatus Dependentiae bacterium]